MRRDRKTLEFGDGSTIDVTVCSDVTGKKRPKIHRWLEIRYLGGFVLVEPTSSDMVKVIIPSSPPKHPALRK